MPMIYFPSCEFIAQLIRAPHPGIAAVTNLDTDEAIAVYRAEMPFSAIFKTLPFSFRNEVRFQFM